MSVINNFKEYIKHKPAYKPWEKEQNLNEAKRINYIKNNRIANKEDIERARVVLNAVDVMDEYSQSKAEDMEVTVGTIKSGILSISSNIGMGLALLVYAKNNMKNITAQNKKTSLIAPALIYIATSGIPAIALSLFGVKQETKASRMGRIEAMETELNSPKQFAILTEEQNAQVEKIAQKINIPKKELKGKEKFKLFDFNGIIKSIKTIVQNKKTQEEKIKEINKKYKSNPQDFTKQLSSKEIEEAKKDRQLIQNIVRKIDIASQEYSENVELATNTASLFLMGSGGLVGIGLNFLLSKLKLTNSKTISAIIGGGIAFLGAVYAASIQKEASRVARYKVKKDFLQNPELLYYVDDEKIKNETITETKTKKKDGYFKNLSNIIKNHKEYKKYIKENEAKQLTLAKAKEQIKLTPEQEKRAKQLQKNTFNMFNTLDEKSQTYAESTEAVGEIVQFSIALPSMLGGLFGMMKSISKGINKKSLLGFALSYCAIIIPPLVLDILTTKEQIKASKTADMLAIKELDDYRHFADYSNKSSNNISANQKSILDLTPPWIKK